jgi:lipopolysaccharide transport system permease protein
LSVLDFREIREYFDLLYFLIWKEIKVRYKQTAIGAAWAVLQPFLAMVIFSIFFGRFAKIPSENVPYPVFAYTALIVWTYFSGSLISATSSVVEYQKVITKIYFPRILLPVSSVLNNLLDFGIAFIVLLLMMAFYHIVPSARLFAVPLFLLLAMMTALGVGLWLSALNVKYRDVRYAIGFVVQVWLFATPVAYPASIVPERFRPLYGLNPMAGIVEGFRWSLLKTQIPDPGMLGISAGVIILTLLGGMYYFRKTEKTFADIV